MTVTINASTSSGIVATADGSGILKVQSNGVTTNALAWVNFAGASGTINAAYNVSSVTRTATGTYTVTFTNALSNANYCPCFSVRQGGTRFETAIVGSASVPSTTAFIILTGISMYGVDNYFFDESVVTATVFGN